MMWPNFQRARRLDSRAAWRTVSVAFGTLSALLMPVLVLLLWLVVQLQVDHESHRIPGGSTEPYLDRFYWPFFGRYDYCLLALIGLGLGVSLLITLSLVFFHSAVHRTALDVIAELRKAIHAQSFRLGSSDLLDVHGARPEELFTDRVEVVHQALSAWLRAVPRSVVVLAGLIVLAMAVDFLLTLLAILMTVLIWRIYVGMFRRSEDGSKIWLDRAERQHHLLLEGLRLAPFTSAIPHSHKSRTAFTDGLRTYCTAVFKSKLSSTVMGPLLILIILISAAGMLLVIGLSPRITVARSVALGTALICAYFPAVGLYQLAGLLQQADRAARDIFDYLDREPRVLQLTGARVLERLQSGIELDRVTVADFNGNKLLEEICLAVPVGDRVGMLASDSRTTLALAGLFVRFYDPVFGRVLFDSRDIRHVTLDSLREQAALVRYNNMLFTGSVAENIDCGDARYSLIQITDAAQRAGAYDFIQQLSQGFETIIGDHGERLLPEQAFRIVLARAMLREPSLLLIDEPANDSDNGIAGSIAKTLAQIATGRTLIYLPSRLETLRSLDRIFLFHEGKLKAEGKHAELLQSSELYRHLTYVRFNPFRNSTN